jgi:glycosyltransferase involved in cell wall biosynthesis
MKIAILGTRGIPARYGGFETFAEQLSKRLVNLGHEVTVYCRRPFTAPDDVVDPRVRRVILPTIKNKHLDTAFHTFLSIFHVLFTKKDLILLCNVANSPLAWMPRLFGIPTVLNVDGLDRKRRKWNLFARYYLGFCELLSVITPTRIVTDALPIQEYFWRRYRKRSTMIAYGAEVPEDCSTLNEFELPKKKYLLYVSRLEPENNPELVVRAYREVKTDWPLVMVGGNCYDHRFVDRLKEIADDRVIFPGPIYGPRYWRLLLNAGLYVSGCEVGGLHPALIEAMAAENAVLALDTPENRETAADCGIYFRHSITDLAGQMSQLIQNPDLRRKLGSEARNRARSLFSWEEVAAKYEVLFSELVKKNGSLHGPTLSKGSRPTATADFKPAPAVLSNPVDNHNLDYSVSPMEGKGKLTS